MTEPTLTCPTCRTEIKLTESLAAPLIEATRKRYEDRLARKEAEVVSREAAIRDQQAQIAAASRISRYRRLIALSPPVRLSSANSRSIRSTASIAMARISDSVMTLTLTSSAIANSSAVSSARPAPGRRPR
jgi:hypothetical protein